MARPSVYINPKFHGQETTRLPPKIYINPNFIQASSQKVHVNPNFLQRRVEEVVEPQQVAAILPSTNRHKLVRNIARRTQGQTQTVKVVSVQKHPIVKSRHKLIRLKTKTEATKIPVKRQTIHKKLVLLKINGVTYKSSRNILQRQHSSDSSKTQNLKRELLQSDKLISLSTGKFLLRHRGQLLQKLSGTVADPPGSSIEVAGMKFTSFGNGHYKRVAGNNRRTYKGIKKSAITLRRQLKKTNVTCPIFQRLGKCLALQRGRCPNVHDPKRVRICPNFLQGTCTKLKCTLSHAVSLAKMPVCRYFLQGVCDKENCMYLHKKISEDATICHEFLRGFCALAEKCPKRHEFPSGTKSNKKTVRPPKEKREAAAVTRYYDQAPSKTNLGLSSEGQKKLEKMLAKVHRLKEHQKAYEAAVVDKIYLPSGTKHHKNDDDDDDYDSPPKRPPIGPLPSFIPI